MVLHIRSLSWRSLTVLLELHNNRGLLLILWLFTYLSRLIRVSGLELYTLLSTLFRVSLWVKDYEGLNFSRIESFKFTTFLTYKYKFVIKSSTITLYFNFFFELPIMATSPFVDEINYCFFHSIIRYINPTKPIQIIIIAIIFNNIGNITIKLTDNIIIKNIPMAFVNAIGSIPQSSSLPHKFSINVFI